MRRRTLAGTCVAIFIAGTVSLRAGAQQAHTGKRQTTEPELFGLTKVVPLHIEISADEYRAMQPPAPAGIPEGPPPALQEKKSGERESERNLVGVQFPWANATVTV